MKFIRKFTYILTTVSAVASLYGQNSLPVNPTQKNIQTQQISEEKKENSTNSNPSSEKIDDSADKKNEFTNPLVATLIERNPFGKFEEKKSSDTPEQTTPTAPEGLELRAVYCIDKKWFFSVADTKLKTNYTIPLGGKVSSNLPYAIDFFDDETNSVSISNNFASYTLTLKSPDRPSGQMPNMILQAQKVAGNNNNPNVVKNTQNATINTATNANMTPQQRQQMQEMVSRRMAARQNISGANNAAVNANTANRNTVNRSTTYSNRKM